MSHGVAGAHLELLEHAEGKEVVVFIKSITNYFIGRVVDTEHNSHGDPIKVCLFPCAWVADQGIRQSKFLREGVTSATEVERYEVPVWVVIPVATEVTKWNHPIPESNALEDGEMGDILIYRSKMEEKYHKGYPFRSILSPEVPVFVKTVTNFFIGHVIDVALDAFNQMSWMTFERESAWVADEGFRQSRFLRRGVMGSDPTEVERYPDRVSVNGYMVTEIVPWEHPIPETNLREEAPSTLGDDDLMGGDDDGDDGLDDGDDGSPAEGAAPSTTPTE